jgi:hypothetical protein
MEDAAKFCGTPLAAYHSAVSQQNLTGQYFL